MKTLYCDYLVAKKDDWWGCITITNHSNKETISYLEVFEFNSGVMKRRTEIKLNPGCSIIISNNHIALKNITGRVRLYLNCIEQVLAKVGNSRGETNAVSWENMNELPFPKV